MPPQSDSCGGLREQASANVHWGMAFDTSPTLCWPRKWLCRSTVLCSPVPRLVKGLAGMVPANVPAMMQAWAWVACSGLLSR